jgi:hypothetical protein
MPETNASGAQVPCITLLDVLRASLARGLSVPDSPDIKHLVELPMTEAEYKLFIQLTSNSVISVKNEAYQRSAAT